jgi:hypothetical protein
MDTTSAAVAAIAAELCLAAAVRNLGVGQHVAALHDAEQREESALGGTERVHRRPGRGTRRGKAANVGGALRRQRVGLHPAVADQQQRRDHRLRDGDSPGDLEQQREPSPRGQDHRDHSPERGSGAEDQTPAQRAATSSQLPLPGIGCGADLLEDQLGEIAGGVEAAQQERPYQAATTRLHRHVFVRPY